MDISFGKEEGCSDGVNGGITPSFIEESTLVIEVIEVCHVTFIPPEI